MMLMIEKFSAVFSCLVAKGMFDVSVISLMNKREGVVQNFQEKYSREFYLMHKLESSYKRIN